MAEAKAHGLSDVDVAVLFDEMLENDAIFFRTLSIGSKLESLLKQPVDVIALNRASTFIRFQVIQKGLLIMERDRTQRCIFQMRAMQRYYDAKPYLDYQRTETIRRIQEQGLGHGYQGTQDSLAENRRLRETFAVTVSSDT